MSESPKNAEFDLGALLTPGKIARKANPAAESVALPAPVEVVTETAPAPPAPAAEPVRRETEEAWSARQRAENNMPGRTVAAPPPVETPVAPTPWDVQRPAQPPVEIEAPFAPRDFAGEADALARAAMKAAREQRARYASEENNNG